MSGPISGTSTDITPGASGSNTGGGIGVFGASDSGNAVCGISASGNGVDGTSSSGKGIGEEGRAIVWSTLDFCGPWAMQRDQSGDRERLTRGHDTRRKMNSTPSSNKSNPIAHDPRVRAECFEVG